MYPLYCCEKEGIIYSLMKNYIRKLPVSEAVPYLRRLVGGFPLLRPGFEPGSRHVGFVVDKAELGQVSSEHFGFPCQYFHRLLNTHHYPSSSGVGTIGQYWAQ
jgi:hypothetical protein